MILSASRRTDIPAFYAPWFANRVRAGYCTVPNPFNRQQVSYVSLQPGDVDAIVFWTRNPLPLLPYLQEFDQLGLRYYFQFTVLNYPKALEARAPSLQSTLPAFKKLSELIGAEKVIWRYDPILLSTVTGVQFHKASFAQIAAQLHGFTRRVVISLLDPYPAASRRLVALEESGIRVSYYQGQPDAEVDDMLNAIVQSAADQDMEIYSCAEPFDLRRYGIQPGKCIDDVYLSKAFGINVSHTKGPGQRPACGCVLSKDIGMYDTCLFECACCYATHSFARARRNHALHDPASPSLLGHYENRSD